MTGKELIVALQLINNNKPIVFTFTETQPNTGKTFSVTKAVTKVEQRFDKDNNPLDIVIS